MGEDRFKDLVILFVHKDIPLDYIVVIALKNPRQMLFVDSLNAEID